jgi:hypothetical protein
MPSTITTDKVFEAYIGNNSTVVPYPITLQWLDDEDLHLFIDGVETGNFVVTPSGFLTTTAVAVDKQVILYRRTAKTQITTFPNNTTPSAVDIRAALNKLTLIAQELEYIDGGKPLSFPLGEDVDFATALPIASERLGKTFFFDDVTGEMLLITPAQLALTVDPSFEALVESKADVSEVAAVDAALTAHIGVYTAAIATKASLTGVETLTNKRITKRTLTVASSATPTVNTDSYDAVTITALAANITSMTSGLTGTPNNFDELIYRIKDNGTARTISWGASFESVGEILPTTTAVSKVLVVRLVYNSVTSKWGCALVSKESQSREIVLATAQNTTSGTEFSFASIPAGVKQVTIMFDGVTLFTVADNFLIQIGDGGVVATTGYVSLSGSRSTESTSTSGFVVFSASTAACSGVLTLSRLENNTWVSSHSMARGTATFAVGGGTKTLSGELDTVKLTRSGTSNFTAGKVNISYRF